MSDAVLASRPAAMRSAVPASRRLAIALAALGTALAVLLVAAMAIARLERRTISKPGVAQPDRGEWVDVPRPRRAITLDAPVLRGIASTYVARLRPLDGSREDVLVFGTPGFDAPAARLRIRRHLDGRARASATPLFAAVAREAADAGFAIERAGLPDLLPTRFGAFEIVDLSLSDGTAAAVPCTGFRLAPQRPAVTIGGLACGALGRPIERSALACLLDRLVLRPEDDDEAMRAFSAAAAGHAPACAEARPHVDVERAPSGDGKAVTDVESSRRH